jgi:hypothetical protein
LFSDLQLIRIAVSLAFPSIQQSGARARRQGSGGPIDTALSAPATLARHTMGHNGPLYQGVDKGSFGYRFLATLGWKEGQGLVRFACVFSRTPKSRRCSGSHARARTNREQDPSILTIATPRPPHHSLKSQGATKQGITSHIRVRQKADALGVGAAEAAADRDRPWAAGMVGYDAILSNLKEIRSAGDVKAAAEKKKRRRRGQDDGDDGYESDGETSSSSSSESGSDSDSDSDSESDTSSSDISSSDSDSSSSSGSDSSDSSSNSDSESSSSSSDDSSSSSDSDGGAKTKKKKKGKKSSSPAAPAVRRVTSTTHLGRYGRREASKRVAGYSAEDLAAILGAPPSEAPAVAAAAAARVGTPSSSAPRSASRSSSSSSSSSEDDSGSDSSSSDDSSDSDSDSGGKQHGNGRPAAAATLAPTTPPKDRSAAAALAAADAVDRQRLAPASSTDPDWWHRAGFVRAGRMGASGDAVRPAAEGKDDKARGFTEQDQEDLAGAAQRGRTQGRRGLGVGTGGGGPLKKVAQWEGTKVCFSEGEEGEEEGDGEQQEAAEQEALRLREEAALAAGVVIVLPKKQQKRARQDGEEGGGGGRAAEDKSGRDGGGKTKKKKSKSKH